MVTGAGSGIGRAIALSLAEGGARAAVTDVAEDRAGAVAREIRAAGGAESHFRLDVWVNNAGVSTMRPFLEGTEDDWRTNMDMNAGGSFLC